LVHRINEAQGKKQLFPIKWTDEALDRIAGDTLIHGSKAADWWARQSEGFKNGMGDQLRMGLSQGESIPDLVRRIFPNAAHLAEAQKEGRAQRDIIGTARRNAEALVRTSTLTVLREANMDVYAANSDVVKGVQWCATLDDRTTPLCQRLDGKVWLLPDYEPDGHDEPFPGTSAHWNCRSAILPELKSWEELAEEAGGDTEWAKKMDEFQETAKGHPDEEGGAQRASKDGYVSARLSYEDWKNGRGPANASSDSEEKPPDDSTPKAPEPEDAQHKKIFDDALAEVLEKNEDLIQEILEIAGIKALPPITLGDLIATSEEWYRIKGEPPRINALAAGTHYPEIRAKDGTVLFQQQIKISEWHLKEKWLKAGAVKIADQYGTYFDKETGAALMLPPIYKLQYDLCHEIAHIAYPYQHPAIHDKLTQDLFARIHPEMRAWGRELGVMAKMKMQGVVAWQGP